MRCASHRLTIRRGVPDVRGACGAMCVVADHGSLEDTIGPMTHPRTGRWARGHRSRTTSVNVHAPFHVEPPEVTYEASTSEAIGDLPSRMRRRPATSFHVEHAIVCRRPRGGRRMASSHARRVHRVTARHGHPDDVNRGRSWTMSSSDERRRCRVSDSIRQADGRHRRLDIVPRRTT